MNEFVFITLEYLSVVYMWDNEILYEDKKQVIN